MFRHNSKGFTLIELMLAMSFVSILLISVAMLTIQISNLYTRGLTMKEINQAGTEITDDIKRSLASQYPGSIKLEAFNGVTILCTGKYTYIANDPGDIETSSDDRILFSADNPVRLAKVRDNGGAFCSNPPTQFLSELGIDAVELLGKGDRNLVVRNLSLTPASREEGMNTTERALYTVSLTLSTGATSELTDTGECRPPSDVQSGREYCAIDTFSTVVAVGNTSGE
jgi:prepilin-type N-terminal cleavage/methylation domain-containing protein